MSAGTKPTVSIVGAGRVGSIIGRAALAAGCEIAAVFSGSEASARSLAADLGSRVASSLADCVLFADIVLLSVPDDAIMPVAQQLASIESTAAVVHTSGYHSIHRLHPLELTRPVGSLHPALPIATVHDTPDRLEHVVFAVESNHPQLTEWLYSLVDAWKGIPITIRPDSKALYHAALSIASNFRVVLVGLAERLLVQAGLDAEIAVQALRPLVQGTVENLLNSSAEDALTGPLVRGDIATISGHLKALNTVGEGISVYLSLSQSALPLLAKRGVDPSGAVSLLDEWKSKCHD